MPKKQKEAVPRAFSSTSRKAYTEMIQEVPPEEEKRKRAAKECIRCIWPLDRKGVHETM
jgi:hypothetical protein